MGGYPSAVRGDANTEIELITPSPTNDGSLHIPVSETLDNRPNVVTGYEDGEAELSVTNPEELISASPSNTAVVVVGSPHDHIHIDISDDLEDESTIVTRNQHGGSKPPIRNEQASTSMAPSDPFSDRLHGFGKLWHIVMAIMVQAAVEFIVLKFENKNQTAFETHPIFANMAIASFFFVIPLSVSLFNITSTKGRKILKALIYMMWILLIVSLVMIFLPSHHNWIGYLSIGVILGVVASHHYKKVFGKKDGSILEASDDD